MPGYAFDRKPIERLSGPFVEWPLLLCSVCHAASLEPSVTDVAGNANGDASDYEQMPSAGLFHGVLTCPRTPCRNTHVVAGGWQVADQSAPVDDIVIKSYFVSYILPPLPLVDFGEAVPDTVRDLVDTASQVLLSDPSAAANRIRSAIEALLDDQGIRKFPPHIRSSRLTTHARIEIFSSKDPLAASHLMAMKWIGNIGSHELKPLALSLVLDGIEHFARALGLIYDPREKALDKRAAFINQRGRKFRPKNA